MINYKRVRPLISNLNIKKALTQSCSHALVYHTCIVSPCQLDARWPRTQCRWVYMGLSSVKHIGCLYFDEQNLKPRQIHLACLHLYGLLVDRRIVTQQDNDNLDINWTFIVLLKCIKFITKLEIKIWCRRKVFQGSEKDILHRFSTRQSTFLKNGTLVYNTLCFLTQVWSVHNIKPN